MNQTKTGKNPTKKIVALLICLVLAVGGGLNALASYGPVSQWTNTITGAMTGNAGTSADPYTVLLSDTDDTKITWKAYEEIVSSYSTNYWLGTSTGTNEETDGLYSTSYKWKFYGGNMTGYVQQPYYTDIALSDTDDDSVYDEINFVCKTKFPGPIDVSIDVSSTFSTGDSVTVSYVTGSCDGSVVHATGAVVVGSSTYLSGFANTFTSGTYTVDSNGYITIPNLYHGGVFSIS